LRQRKAQDENRSCGSQSAHQSLINRRLAPPRLPLCSCITPEPRKRGSAVATTTLDGKHENQISIASGNPFRESPSAGLGIRGPNTHTVSGEGETKEFQTASDRHTSIKRIARSSGWSFPAGHHLWRLSHRTSVARSRHVLERRFCAWDRGVRGSHYGCSMGLDPHSNGGRRVDQVIQTNLGKRAEHRARRTIDAGQYATCGRAVILHA
jgi:hypothetical protein